MKILSRRSRNDLARLENHHDIDPATLGILEEHWLEGTVMKMNVLMIILLLISEEYWQLIWIKTMIGHPDKHKAQAWKISEATLVRKNASDSLMSQWEPMGQHSVSALVWTSSPDRTGHYSWYSRCDWDLFLSELPVNWLVCLIAVWYPPSVSEPFKPISTRHVI